MTVNLSNYEVFQKRLRQAVKASTLEVQEEAQLNHAFTSRTGQLERAIDVAFNESAMTGTVYIDSQAAPHGPFVHKGTRAHDIFPKDKHALRWVPQGGGQFRFAKKVHHPGTRSDPFLYDALKAKKDDIRRIFAQYTKQALKEVIQDELGGNRQYTLKIT